MNKHLLYICIFSSIYHTAFADDQVLPTISLQSQPNTQTYSNYQSNTSTRTPTSIQETPQEVIIINKNILNDIQATRLSDGLDIAGIGRGNNFGGQGLTTYTVRGFTSGEYFKNEIGRAHV